MCVISTPDSFTLGKPMIKNLLFVTHTPRIAKRYVVKYNKLLTL